MYCTIHAINLHNRENDGIIQVMQTLRLIRSRYYPKLMTGMTDLDSVESDRLVQ